MDDSVGIFNLKGFLIVENVILNEAISELEFNLSKIPNGVVGTRNLLSFDWCKELTKSIGRHPILSKLLPKHGAAVQCTYFDKSLKRNWLVPLHQDLVIPVQERFSIPNWTMWSIKEGVHYVRPPMDILQTLVAVRVHLEDNSERNGPVQLIAGSHLNPVKADLKTTCLVSKGGALVMRPLILHSSSKIVEGRRRVLHFLYGPEQLPQPFKWANAVRL